MHKTAFSKWVAHSLRLVRGICGVALVLTALSEPAYAQKKKKPEIDPGSSSGALVLLAGGILLMRESLRRR